MTGYTFNPEHCKNVEYIKISHCNEFSGRLNFQIDLYFATYFLPLRTQPQTYLQTLIPLTT